MRIAPPAGLPPNDQFCYWKVDGVWFVWVPHDRGHAFLGNLSRHDVTEHEDGTITVAPSILITGHDGQVHGFLEHGVWRAA